MKYRCRYIYEVRHGSPIHVWTLIGRDGGIHLHIHEHEIDGEIVHEGGIEIHYRVPPKYMSQDAPSEDCCWLIRCPCWHDGSSLQAQEKWIPIWHENKHDHDSMFRALCAYADEAFSRE